jgi:hypothetical protein
MPEHVHLLFSGLWSSFRHYAMTIGAQFCSMRLAKQTSHRQNLLIPSVSRPTRENATGGASGSIHFLLRLRSEDQKIIHAVGFHEILRIAQFVSGLGGFANDYVFIHAVIFSVAIAINDANLSSRSQR